MNPYSPEQKYAREIVYRARERCLQEKENTKLLIQHKLDMIARTNEIIEIFDTEVGREPIRISDRIVLPSPVEMFEEEARYHATSLDYQQDRLIELKEAEKSIDNALRRQKQTYDYKTYQDIWQQILEKAELANEVWYIEQNLASPARESLSQQSDG